MPCELTLDGHLSIGGSGCGCDSGDLSQTTRGLSLSCSASSFAAIKSTDCAMPLSTAGAVGAAWAELPVTLSKYALLSLKSSAAIKVRLFAAPASKLGSGATFPATTLNAVTWDLEVDGQPFTVTFAGASLSATQVVAQVNAAAALAGLTSLPASVGSTGQVQLTGVLTGAQGSLVAEALAAAGFAQAVELVGSGEDLPVRGPFLVQFGDEGPTRIQVSGQSQIEVLAAGTP